MKTLAANIPIFPSGNILDVIVMFSVASFRKPYQELSLTLKKDLALLDLWNHEECSRNVDYIDFVEPPQPERDNAKTPMKTPTASDPICPICPSGDLIDLIATLSVTFLRKPHQELSPILKKDAALLDLWNHQACSRIVGYIDFIYLLKSELDSLRTPPEASVPISLSETPFEMIFMPSAASLRKSQLELNPYIKKDAVLLVLWNLQACLWNSWIIISPLSLSLEPPRGFVGMMP
jgi:hypothetical protein